MGMRTYRVKYRANDGTFCRFKFETDASFAYYRSCYAQTLGGMGTPFFNALMGKADEIMGREDSAMKRHGGFSIFGLREIKCLDTGRVRHFYNPYEA